MEVSASYSPHTHQAAVNDATVNLERVKRGQCPADGNQTHRVGCCGLMRTPLNIDALVHNGVCLLCHPEFAAPVKAGALRGALAGGRRSSELQRQASRKAAADREEKLKRELSAAKRGEAQARGASAAAEERAADSARKAKAAVAKAASLRVAFAETGGNAGCRVSSSGVLGRKNNKVFRKTEENGFSHAVTTRIGSGRVDVKVLGGTSQNWLLVGLAADGKDVARDGEIHWDSDVWLINCYGGSLFSASGRREGVGEVADGDVLSMVYDSGVGRLSFLRNGVAWGGHDGVPPAAKVIVSMRHAGQAVQLA